MSSTVFYEETHISKMEDIHMLFVEIKDIPRTGRATRGILEERLEKFISMGIKNVKNRL